MSQDHELNLFCKGMEILVDASRLQFNPFVKDHFMSSVGVDGYGHIDTLDRLAGALNYKGYRTSKGKYLTGNNLKKMKSNLIKKYGENFTDEYVDWMEFGTELFRYTHLNDLVGTRSQYDELI